MSQRIVSMTPFTNGNIKTIQAIRGEFVKKELVYHEGAGQHAGIIINKEPENNDCLSDPHEMQLEFTCLMQNNRTIQTYAENRRLKFWFLQKTVHNHRLAESYEFFKDLVNQDLFPKDYVGFIKRMLKQLQSDRYPHIRRVDLDIVPLGQSEQESLVPERKEKPVEVVVREEVLRRLDEAFPNVLSVDDLIRITEINDVNLLNLQLKQLQTNNTIEPVYMNSSHVKRMGYRRKLQVCHKVEVIHSGDTMRAVYADHQQPSIAIITNLLCEKVAVDSFLQRKVTYVRYKSEGDSNVYTLGHIGPHKVISVKLSMVGHELQAKISSGSITTRLLGAFQAVRHVILVGVGGAVPHVCEFERHSRLGDVVISGPNVGPTGLELRHELEVQTGEEPLQQTPPPAAYIYCDRVADLANDGVEQQEEVEPAFSCKMYSSPEPSLLGCARRLLDECHLATGQRIWQEYIEEGQKSVSQEEIDFSRPPADSDKLKLEIGEGVTVDVKHPEPPATLGGPLNASRPQARLGCIGSGRAVTDNAATRDCFARRYGLLAYDAEFDQVLESLVGNQITSFLIIRGIADYVEGRQATSIWQPYAALSAAAFAKAVILQLPPLDTI